VHGEVNEVRIAHERMDARSFPSLMSGPVRRAEFDATLDDFVDVGWRSTRRTAWRRTLRRAPGCIGGALAVLVATLVLVKQGHVTPSLACAIAGASIAFGGWIGVTWRANSEGATKKRLRRAYSDILEGKESVHCEIELRPQGIWWRQGNVETLTAWADLRDVSIAEGAIELRFRTSFFVVRDRGFASAAERQAFLDQARALATSPART
jgi:hypothetical protein